MTQAERIIEYMRTYGEITPVDALRDLSVMRLAARIADIKAMGYKVKSRTVASKNRFGEKIHFTAYSLEEAA